MITNTAIRAPSDTPGTSRKLCQSQYSRAADMEFSLPGVPLAPHFVLSFAVVCLSSRIKTPGRSPS